MDRLSNLGLSHNAPPSSSSTFIGGSGQSLASRLKPNLGGVNAFQRERDLSARYGAYGSGAGVPKKSEWDVLKDHHRFIRDNEEVGDVSWEERLARAYESKLFKEFALHYKSKQFALRWRTAPEVVEGVGEDTCAGLRCKYHRPSSSSTSLDDDTPREQGRGARWSSDEGDGDERERRKEKRRRRMPVLKAFELPFKYTEAGEAKEALVKVRLCPRCVGKLLWKPKQPGEVEVEDERKRARRRNEEERRGVERDAEDHRRDEEGRISRDEGDKTSRRRSSRDRHRRHSSRDRSRSRSPRRRNEI